MSSHPSSPILLQVIVCLLVSSYICEGWVNHAQCSFRPGNSISSSAASPLCESTSSSQSRLRTILASSTSSSEGLTVASNDDDDDDDDYEYVEYEILTEAEFTGSEWLVGTIFDGRENIGETWVRLATDEDGKNVAIWGDNAEGNWNWDTANQFLSVSKNRPWGKNIWAGVVDDFYYCRGSIRGWNFFSPASVVGQWQARRLGIENGEAGVAPWFEQEEEEPSAPALTE